MEPDTWKPLGEVVAGIVGGLRDQQMRREFVRRVHHDEFAALCARHGVDPASVPDAPISEAAE